MRYEQTAQDRLHNLKEKIAPDYECDIKISALIECKLSNFPLIFKTVALLLAKHFPHCIALDYDLA